MLYVSVYIHIGSSRHNDFSKILKDFSVKYFLNGSFIPVARFDVFIKLYVTIAIKILCPTYF